MSCRSRGQRVCLAAAFLMGLEVAGAGCVPGSASGAGDYEVSGGNVLDRKTGLTWSRCSVGQRWTDDNGCVGVVLQMEWAAAMALDMRGWRLPTRDELATLIVRECMNPAINETLFPDMELTKLWYWTSTIEGSAAWYVAFGGGSVRLARQQQENSVRLVRSYRP